MATKKRRVFGASRLRRKLKRLPTEVSEQLRRTIAVEADAVLQEMRRLVPVSQGDEPLKGPDGKPRKHLRDQIEVRISKDGLFARIGLMGKRSRTTFFFARFLEFGTRKMSKRAFVFPGWKVRQQKARKAVKDATIRALTIVANSNPPDN